MTAVTQASACKPTRLQPVGRSSVRLSVDNVANCTGGKTTDGADGSGNPGDGAAGIWRIALALLLFLAPIPAGAIGQTRYVLDRPAAGAFPIVHAGTAATIYVDSADWPGVARAAGDLQADIARVTGVKAAIVHDAASLGAHAIIIGTIGRSALVDRLIGAKRIDASGVAGKWEAFVIQATASALVIAGSDKRGAIYGVYDVSEQIGVSPWYF